MVNIKRDAFHHNFLKSIVVRLDLQTVLEAEMKIVSPYQVFRKGIRFFKIF